MGVEMAVGEGVAVGERRGAVVLGDGVRPIWSQAVHFKSKRSGRIRPRDELLATAVPYGGRPSADLSR